MFVQSPPATPSSPSRYSQHYPYAAKPLMPLHSNVFAASESCIQLQWPEAPQNAYSSPLHKHIHDVLVGQAAQSTLFSGAPSQRPCSPTKQHPHWSDRNGLGFGIDRLGQKADLLTVNSNNNARTRGAFKPQRAQKGTNSWQLKQFAEATLGSGSLRKVVKLPEGEDRDEWLAVNGEYISP